MDYRKCHQTLLPVQQKGKYKTMHIINLDKFFRQTREHYLQGAHSFSTMTIHDFSMTKK